MLKPLLTAVLLLGSVTPVLAGEAINERRPLNADATLSVKNLAGVIEVQAWARNEIQLSGWLGQDAEQLEISGDAKRLSIEARYPRKLRGSVEDTELRLQVPAGVTLQLEAVSADIRVSGVRGPIAASSVSGDVQMDVTSQHVTASTVSGNLKLRAPSAQTRLASISGDLEASGGVGTLSAETVSGELQISGGPYREVKIESVSGDLSLGLSLEEGATLSAETLSGDIEVRLPTLPNAKLTMKTFSGDLRNGFVAAPAAADADDKRHLEMPLGNGKGSIRLNSFSGDIQLDRANRR